MPRPLPAALRPFEAFIADRGPEITATLRMVCRKKGRLPTGLTDEDVAQHAITELKRRYARMSDEDAAVKFAVKVGGNFLVDEYRAERSRADQAWRARVVQRAGEPLSAEQAAFTRMRHGRLAEGLRRLPPRQRQAVELFYFDRLRRKQIASRLGVPESTVKGLLQRGLASLREHMKHAPALLPPWLRRAAEVAVVASPRLLTALLTLTVLSVPAPMVRVPHVERLAVPSGVDWDMPVRLVVSSGYGGPSRALLLRALPSRHTRTTERAGDDRGRIKKGVKVGTKLGDDQVGRFGGDEVCVQTGTGQEPFPPCANQNLVGMCPLLRRLGLLIDPYTTCERHSDPVHEPPPLP